MSLSSLLLSSKALIDTDLDVLFKTTVAKVPDANPVPGPSKRSSKQKRKLEIEKDAVVDTPQKRAKSSLEKQPSKSSQKAKKDDQATTKSTKTSTIDKAQEKSSKKGKGKETKPVSDDDDSDDNSDLENAYVNEKVAPETKKDDSGSEEDDDLSPPVHEALQKDGKKKVRQPKKKYVPQEETPELRDRRTIFIGNLPLEVASKNPLKKQLQHHILTFVPSAKIESVRFRSIPFQAPTAKLPTSDDEGDNSKTKSKAQPPQKELRSHEKERASIWRSKLDEKDEENIKTDDKKFLNPAQKKKIAFINQEFHSTADTVNAYVVFAHAASSEGRPANLPPLPPTMDPYEAALLAAGNCDGSLFLERMLRVDLVGKDKSAKSRQNADMDHKSGVLEADPRLSVFVGNLDFASKEEDLRVFFEGVLSTERGPPPTPRQDDNEDDASCQVRKPPTWVTRVRIIRDKDTLLGKGFAYVQFADRECVDELLALEEEKLKFAKRKLRVQRCKTLPGSKRVVTGTAKQANPARVHVVIPKGDPALGEKLAGLPKEERKKLKSTDSDRVARRLAKKKARMAMAPGVGKVGKPKKERKRVRS